MSRASYPGGMRLGFAAALVATALLVLAPSATALGVSYTIRAGAVAGDNGWYRSDLTVDIVPQDATDTTCPSVKTFRSSADVLDCKVFNGPASSDFHLQFKID